MLFLLEVDRHDEYMTMCQLFVLQEIYILVWFSLQDACDNCDIHDCTLTTMLAKAGVVGKNYTKLVKLGPRTVIGCTFWSHDNNLYLCCTVEIV